MASEKPSTAQPAPKKRERSALRATVLSEPRPPNLEMEIGDATYFIRSPLLTERNTILSMAGVQPDAEGQAKTTDTGKLAAAAAIVLVVDENDAPVFELADMDALQRLPVNGVADQLAQAALKRMLPQTKGKGSLGNG